MTTPNIFFVTVLDPDHFPDIGKMIGIQYCSTFS